MGLLLPQLTISEIMNFRFLIYATIVLLPMKVYASDSEQIEERMALINGEKKKKRLLLVKVLLNYERIVRR